MKIAMLGAGAMGGLYSAYLSRQNEVTVIDVNAALVEKISADGLLLHEPDGSTEIFRPAAVTDSLGMEPVDLVVVFVKAMFTAAALENNRHIIGPNTYLMTLQNGSGHEDTLGQFADPAHLVIGVTQHNASIAGLGETRHGGSGKTVIGCPSGNSAALLPIAEAFSTCGLECIVSDEVQQMIWGKLFTNVSASALTGLLQVPLGFISADPHAWAACRRLIEETVAVAAGMGMSFDLEEKCAEVKAICDRSPQGLTSIYADLRDGRRTEVDTISGSVVRAGAKYGVPTPSHALLIDLIHAMEAKSAK